MKKTTKKSHTPSRSRTTKHVRRAAPKRAPKRTRSAKGETVLSKPQIIAAAVRFYEKDHKQRDIAKTITKRGISSSYLARILIKSRKAGVFKVKVFEGTKSGARVAKARSSAKRRARRPGSKRK